MNQCSQWHLWGNIRQRLHLRSIKLKTTLGIKHIATIAKVLLYTSLPCVATRKSQFKSTKPRPFHLEGGCNGDKEPRVTLWNPRPLEVKTIAATNSAINFTLSKQYFSILSTSEEKVYWQTYLLLTTVLYIVLLSITLFGVPKSVFYQCA